MNHRLQVQTGRQARPCKKAGHTLTLVLCGAFGAALGRVSAWDRPCRELSLFVSLATPPCTAWLARCPCCVPPPTSSSPELLSNKQMTSGGACALRLPMPQVCAALVHSTPQGHCLFHLSLPSSRLATHICRSPSLWNRAPYLLQACLPKLLESTKAVQQMAVHWIVEHYVRHTLLPHKCFVRELEREHTVAHVAYAFRVRGFADKTCGAVDSGRSCNSARMGEACGRQPMHACNCMCERQQRRHRRRRKY